MVSAVSQIPDDAALARWFGGFRASAARGAESFPANIAASILAGYDGRIGQTTRANGSPVAVANEWAAERIGRFKVARVGHAYDEALIRDCAENYAMRCAVLLSTAPAVPTRGSALGEEWRRLCLALDFAASMGVPMVRPPGATAGGVAARLMDSTWWRRQLRKAWTRSAENVQREVGRIRKGLEPYASDAAVKHRGERLRRTREWMESRAMVNEQGEQLPLLQLADKSLANPALRRGEFMSRMRGFEEIARDLGHVALFFTLTAPSAFHAQHSGGGENVAWVEAKRPHVRKAQEWLRKMWARSRAKLARLSVLFYGFRVAEPHHDGTPHWHMVLFMAPSQVDVLRAVVRGMWLSENGDERGAAEHRCKCITIEPGKGSATGYVAKYVSKNIDGAGAIGDETSDETGESVSSGVARVAAWASCHGIRQFQQVGGPPVGLWRECRRARTVVADVDIERARVAADGGKWADFIYALHPDHIRAGRRVPLKIERPASRIFSPLEPATNGYGEEKRQPVIGLRYCGAVVITRPHRWRIERKESNTPGVVMNPPASAARGAEARNHTHAHSRRPCHGMVPPGSVQAARDRGEVPSESRFFSDLGPVAITVRGAVSAPDGSFAWVMTAPFRPGESFGDPGAWTSRETSMAGPESLQ